MNYQQMAAFHAERYAENQKLLAAANTPSLFAFYTDEVTRHQELYLNYSAQDDKPLLNAGFTSTNNNGTMQFIMQITSFLFLIF